MLQVGGTVRLSRKQFEFRHAKERFRGFVGGIGSGKTYVGAYDLLMRAKPGRLYMVSAPTYRILKDATFRTFRQIAEHLGLFARYHKSDFLVELATGAQVIFRSCDDPEHLRGPNLSGFWLDEGSISPEEAFTIGIGRLRESEDAWFSSTFTPKGKFHWTYKQFAPQQNDKTGLFEMRPQTSLVVSRTAENPFLPTDFERLTREQYTSTVAAQELDGKFLDPAGALMLARWFNIVERSALPDKFDKIVRFWDLAATEQKDANDPDWVVGILMGRVDRIYSILDMQRMRGSPMKVQELIKWTAELDGVRVPIRIEQEGGASGKLAISDIGRMLDGWDIKGVKPDGDKAERAGPMAACAEQGRMNVVRAHWNRIFLDEMGAFPNKKIHDDIVDASSGAYTYLHTKRSFSIGGGSKT